MTKEEHSVIGGNFEQGTAREIMETVVWNNTCDLVDDRDYWKARAQALERAIKECSVKDEDDLKCHMCVNEGRNGYYDTDGTDEWIDRECDWCVDRANWVFDQERFKG